MKKYLLLAALGLSSIGIAQAKKNAQPKLVVGIVLDQMRWDYLHRFADRFGDDGFKRIMNGGFNAQNTNINYLPSYTGPGHATVYTGSVPALHGITANDWINRIGATAMYCAQDDSVTSVGNDGKAGKMSPKNLLATTIADELKLATNFKAKTIGISLKDRGAILPVGHTANGAYWFDGSDGKFISSSYYAKALPEWVQQFNQKNHVDSLLNIDWQTLYPINTYTQSTPDNNNYEQPFKGRNTPTFPHTFKDKIASDKGVIRNTPWGNTLSRLMAEAAIEGEGLGQDEITDLLALSFSSTDYIGHQFGPNAIEIEDCYLRIDQELALFMKYLDKKVGKNNYTLFLTADHGGAHNVTFLKENRIPGGNFSERETNKILNDTLNKVFGVANLVTFNNYQIYFNEALIQKNNIKTQEVAKICKTFLENLPAVSFVLNMKDTDPNVIPAKILEKAINAYNPNRSGEMQVVLEPGHYAGFGTKGTTHGSWNPYDTRIPLLFYGFGVKKGSSYAPYNMTDIAPTIAAILNIQEPNANIGTPILEALKKQ